MARMFLDLWPFLCQMLVFVALPALAILGVTSSPPEGMSEFILWAPPLFLTFSVCVWAWRHHRLWSFARRARHFRTVSGERVVLRYAPLSCGITGPEAVLRQAEGALADLEVWFGPLDQFWRGVLQFRKRVHVYLFPSGQAVEAVFGPGYWATALTQLHAVVVPAQGWPLAESLRYELAHLFATRWNALAPPLLSVGLATWLQGDGHSYPLDGRAAAFLREGRHRLRPLLGRRHFYGRENCRANYALAGSFTGFLVARFGWRRYRRFYRRQQGRWGFDANFEDQFGPTLEDAEAHWREGVLRRCQGSAARARLPGDSAGR